MKVYIKHTNIGSIICDSLLTVVHPHANQWKGMKKRERLHSDLLCQILPKTSRWVKKVEEEGKKKRVGLNAYTVMRRLGHDK